MDSKRITVEIPVVKVIVLTEEEYEQQLNILKTMLQIHQEYSGELMPADLHIAIRELIKLSHMVQATEQLLAAVVEARLIDERLLIIDGKVIE